MAFEKLIGSPLATPAHALPRHAMDGDALRCSRRYRKVELQTHQVVLLAIFR